MGNDIYEVMSTQRAVRRLRPDPIAPAVLDRVLQAACWAPSGGNQQPWRVVVISDPEAKRFVESIYQEEWAQYTAELRRQLQGLPAEVLEPVEKSMRAGDYLAEHLHDAPVLLLFCANPDAMAITDDALDRVSMVAGASVYPAVQNLLLACVAEGLGCTLTTLHCRREPEVKERFAIPERWATVALVPIGHPVGRGHGPITRHGASVMAAHNHFAQPWLATDAR